MTARSLAWAVVLASLLAVGAPYPSQGAVGAGRAAERARVQTMVAHEALRMGFPVSLALAVAQAESDFNPHAESAKGARGVMQVMPATAIGEYGIHPDRLWDPRVNIRLGIHFLKRLVKRYRGRTDLALSYYNGGSNVGTPGRARIIPATARYVRNVQAFARQYARYGWRGS